MLNSLHSNHVDPLNLLPLVHVMLLSPLFVSVFNGRSLGLEALTLE